jgi:hypothetical protein
LKNFSNFRLFSLKMKVNGSTASSLNNNKVHPAYNRNKCPLPLVTQELTKEEYELKKKTKFEVRNDPTDPQSLKHTVMVTHIDGSEDARTVIKWKKEVEAVRIGVGIKKSPAVVRFIASLCEGSARDAYLSVVAERREQRKEEGEDWAENHPLEEQDKDETDAAFSRRKKTWESEKTIRSSLRKVDHQAALQAILLDALPYKALTKQKRYMRRHMKKPAGMKVRTYAAHINKINKEELGELPPFRENQLLDKDEIVEIILNGVPAAWETEMDKHDFDPELRTTGELIEFCERMESAEERRGENSNDNRNNNSQNGSRKKSKSNGNSTGNKKPTGKWCTFHDTDSHDTSECRQQKFHGTNADGSPKKADKSKNNNNKKQHGKNNNQGQFVSKKEVNAMMKKFAKEATKEWTKLNKKRSAEEANMTEVIMMKNHDSYKVSNPTIADDDTSEMSTSGSTVRSVISSADKDIESHLRDDKKSDNEYDVREEQFQLETNGKQPST